MKALLSLLGILSLCSCGLNPEWVKEKYSKASDAEIRRNLLAQATTRIAPGNQREAAVKEAAKRGIVRAYYTDAMINYDPRIHMTRAETLATVGQPDDMHTTETASSSEIKLVYSRPIFTVLTLKGDELVMIQH